MKSFTYNINNINTAAQWLLANLGNKRIIAFDAPMGAGKTTLIAEICKILNTNDHVSSPTFALANEYVCHDGKLISHLDLYRLKSIDEAIEIGIERYLEASDFCFIEWAEIIHSLLQPIDTLFVNINIIDNQTRKIIINT